MARDYAWFQNGKFSLADVQVSAANAASANFQKYLFRPELRYRRFSDLKRPFRNRAGLFKKRS